MSRTPPYIHVPSIAAQKAAVRAVIGAGLISSTLSADVYDNDIDGRPDVYARYPYLRIHDRTLDWCRRPPPGIQVNSPAHLVHYLKSGAAKVSP